MGSSGGSGRGGTRNNNNRKRKFQTENTPNKKPRYNDQKPRKNFSRNGKSRFGKKPDANKPKKPETIQIPLKQVIFSSGNCNSKYGEHSHLFSAFYDLRLNAMFDPNTKNIYITGKKSKTGTALSVS